MTAELKEKIQIDILKSVRHRNSPLQARLLC